MSRWDEPEETFAVGDLTVEIVRDNYPDSPAESEGDDLFLIALGSEFHVVTKQWDCRGGRRSPSCQKRGLSPAPKSRR